MNLFEIGILHWVQSVLACDFMDAFMKIATCFGEGGVFWIAVSLVLILIPKTRKAGLSSGLALLIGVIIVNLIIKKTVCRVRPFDVDVTLQREALKATMDKIWDFSFPSGHSLASFEAATAIFIRNKKLGAGALAIAVLVSFSRIYLCLHYPTDVLGGMLLGIGFAVLASFLVNKGYEIYEKKIALRK